MTDIQFIFVF